MRKHFNRKTLLQLLVTSLTLLVGAHLVDSVSFSEPWIALITALVLAILNIFLKPLLVVLTIPATLFTFGLFLLVINAAIILIASEIVPGFETGGFWDALLLSLLISIVNGLIFNVRIQKIEQPRDFE